MHSQELFQIERIESFVRQVATIGRRSDAVAKRGVKRMIRMSERTVYPFDNFFSMWKWRALRNAWGRNYRTYYENVLAPNLANGLQTVDPPAANQNAK